MLEGNQNPLNERADPFFRDRITYVMLALALSVGIVKGGALAPIVLGGGLLLGAGFAQGGLARARFFWIALVLLAALAGHSLFASAPEAAWRQMGNLALIFVPLGIFLSAPLAGAPALLRKSGVWLGAGFLALSALLAFYYLQDAQTGVSFDETRITKLNRGFSYGALFVWPLLPALWRENRRGFWFLAAVFLLALGLTHSRAAQMATFLGMGTYLASLVMPRLVAAALAGVSALSCFWAFGAAALFDKAPQLAAQIPASWRARLEIWDYMAARLAEHPWQGWGLGAGPSLDWHGAHAPLYVVTHFAAAHAHNAPTQLWGELGLFGLALWLMLSGGALWAVGWLAPRLRPAALAALAAFLVLGLSAYNFWTDSLWAALGLEILLFRLLNQRERPASETEKDVAKAWQSV